MPSRPTTSRMRRPRAAGRRRHGRGGPPAADRRRDGRRRPRAAARGREVPGGEHARGHRRASRRRSTRCAPGLPGIEIDSTDLPAGDLHRVRRSATSRSRCWSASCSSAGALILLFRDWRAALVSMVEHPAFLRCRRLVLALSGVTINAMVLAGLALRLGLVVDDAVVGVDAIARRLRRQPASRRCGAPARRDHRRRGSRRRASSALRDLLVAAGARPALLRRRGRRRVPPAADRRVRARHPGFARRRPHSGAWRWPPCCHQPSDQAPGLPRSCRGYSDATRVPGAAWQSLLDRPRLARLVVGLVVIAFAGFAACSRRSAKSVTAHLPASATCWSTGRLRRARPRSEMNRDHRPRPAASCAAIPGVRQRRRPRRTGRPVRPDRCGINSGELWVSIEPDAPTTTRRVDAIRRVVGGLPRARTRTSRPTRRSRIDEVLTDDRGRDRARLRATTTPRSQAKAEEVQRARCRRRRA